LALFALSFAPATMAATFEGSEMYSLGSKTEVDDDLYVGAANVSISGNVMADLFAFGSNVLINGVISHDLFSAGGSVNIFNDVNDDARVAGGQVMIGGNIGDELMAAGGMVQLLSDSTVGGDAVLAGGLITVEGEINGDTLIYGDEILIDGTLHGDLTIESGSKLTFGSSAVVDGNINHKGTVEAIINEGAVINGELVFEKTTRGAHKGDGFKFAFFAFVGVVNLIKLLVLLATALVLLFVFKKFTKEVVRLGLTKPGRGFLTGFVISIVVPVTAVILIVTILGAAFGILGLMAYAFFMLLAKIYGGIVLGGLFAKWAKSKVGIDWKWALLGVFVLQVVCLIPIIGWLIYCAFFLIAFGSLLQICYKKLWLTR